MLKSMTCDINNSMMRTSLPSPGRGLVISKWQQSTAN
jgi:hypothetical protein